MVAGRPPPIPQAGRSDVLLRVRGLVQGVGFRPFVHREATRLGLGGWVLNNSEGVLIRAVGPAPAVTALVRALETDAPPAARVEEVETCQAGASDPAPSERFTIAPSVTDGSPATTAIPPDLALCEDCRRELHDAWDRRYRYPFINCTQCGPRYTIMERLPYDRPKTTMRAFRMCPACAAEYSDTGSRRFHAQPNACPVCGPRVTLRTPMGECLGDAAIAGASGALSLGQILAVKGIGGYHLMVDAGNEAAVAELRRRKHRDEKPFAVMFPDMAAVRRAAEISPEQEDLIDSPAAPIVLLRRRSESALAASIAPLNPWVGAMLPYSPLHVLLLEAFALPVVATSGNLAEEPLCHDEKEAHQRLAGIADAFLDHDRPIAHPVDDSVVRVSATGPILLRRARGYAPAPLRLPAGIDGSLLCVGAQMKSTVAVAAGDSVVLSPHIGDLDASPAQEVFRRTVLMLGEIHGSAFTRVACDRHPELRLDPLRQGDGPALRRRAAPPCARARLPARAPARGGRRPRRGVGRHRLRGGRHDLGRRIHSAAQGAAHGASRACARSACREARPPFATGAAPRLGSRMRQGTAVFEAARPEPRIFRRSRCS
jgi:hydrogenase maturation protein HypF